MKRIHQNTRSGDLPVLSGYEIPSRKPGKSRCARLAALFETTAEKKKSPTKYFIPEGEKISVSTAKTRGLFYIRSGSARLLFLPPYSGPVPFLNIGEGEFIGLSWLFLSSDHIIAEATTDLDLLFLPAENVLDELSKDPALAFSAASCFSEEIDQVEKVISRLRRNYFRRQTAQLLLRLAKPERTRTAASRIVYSLREMASMLNVSVDVLSDCLSYFFVCRMIDVDKKGIRLLDKEQLFFTAIS